MSSIQPLPTNINYFLVSGVICGKIRFRKFKGKGVIATTSIKLLSSGSKNVYLQVIAMNEVAKALNLISEIGNTLLIEGKFKSNIKLNENRKKTCRTYLLATNVELIAKSTIPSEESLNEKLEIMLDLDPLTYLGDNYDVKD